MRKLFAGLMAIMLTVLGTSSLASAQETQSEDQTTKLQSVDTVDCMLLNFTDPAVTNDDHSYTVGTPISLTAALTDPNNTVANILFAAGMDQKGGVIQEGLSTSAVWTPVTAGEWIVGVQLFDAEGTEIIPTGDCDVNLTVVDADPAVPELSPEPPAEPTPVPNDPAGDIGSDIVVAPTTAVVASAGPTHVVSSRELPRTGSGTTNMAIIGFMMLFCGSSFILLEKRN